MKTRTRLKSYFIALQIVPLFLVYDFFCWPIFILTGGKSLPFFGLPKYAIPVTIALYGILISITDSTLFRRCFARSKTSGLRELLSSHDAGDPALWANTRYSLPFFRHSVPATAISTLYNHSCAVTGDAPTYAAARIVQYYEKQICALNRSDLSLMALKPGYAVCPLPENIKQRDKASYVSLAVAKRIGRTYFSIFGTRFTCLWFLVECAPNTIEFHLQAAYYGPFWDDWVSPNDAYDEIAQADTIILQDLLLSKWRDAVRAASRQEPREHRGEGLQDKKAVFSRARKAARDPGQTEGDPVPDEWYWTCSSCSRRIPEIYDFCPHCGQPGARKPGGRK